MKPQGFDFEDLVPHNGGSRLNKLREVVASVYRLEVNRQEGKTEMSGRGRTCGIGAGTHRTCRSHSL